VGFLSTRSRKTHVDIDYGRLEERCRVLATATEQWRTILRDMERSGESGDPRYDQYLEAYIDARQQEKRADLELFNLKQGLFRR
jgi:hypothetical protein